MTNLPLSLLLPKPLAAAPTPPSSLSTAQARPTTSPPPPSPHRFFRRPFPPPSPAKHIKAVLARRLGKKATASVSIPEGVDLDKRFGFSKELTSRLEVGDEVGRGHFGYTCSAVFKKGEFKGHQVAVKVIPKAKMTTAIAIEDVRREVKILRALTGHTNLVQFYDAFEDSDNVYIVMELCEGGELLDRILSRGGKYSEDDAKTVMVQILNVVAFCHLQGVVHRDLKPENFLYTAKDECSPLKAIDFGLSDFTKPDDRLNAIVGSAYYVAPEVLHRSYIPDLIVSLNALQYRRMDFEEFCAAALSVHQLEALDRWEQHARCAYEIFEKDGNRAIVIEELASELGLGPSIPLHVVLHDWIRHTDGKLSFLGFVKLLHGVSSRTFVKA